MLEDARRKVASKLGCAPADVVFTSGGTEACALALRVVSESRGVVTSDVEHAAVREPLLGRARALPASAFFPPFSFAQHLSSGDTLVLQWVNHETGVLFPMEQISARTKEVGAELIVDATQALGRFPIDVRTLGCSAIAVASSKIGGPSGVGAVYVRRGLEPSPLWLGGGQERGRRSGTPSVPLIAGFAAAVESLDDAPSHETHREQIEAAVRRCGGQVNADGFPRSAHVVNASFPKWRSDHLVAALDIEGLAVSAGSACAAGAVLESAIVLALHPDEPWRARSCVRFSFGHATTDADVERACEILERVVPRAT